MAVTGKRRVSASERAAAGLPAALKVGLCVPRMVSPRAALITDVGAVKAGNCASAAGSRAFLISVEERRYARGVFPDRRRMVGEYGGTAELSVP
jgi:hypothetical protein